MKVDIDELLDAFGKSGIDPQHTVVRCETQEEADIFLSYLVHEGVWEARAAAQLSDKWGEHGSDTCYHFSQRRWCYADYYRLYNPEFEIVDFCDIYKNQVVEPTMVTFSYDELFT